MIGKYLDLCTSHLTNETVDKLVMEQIPNTTSYNYEEGMFIIVPSLEHDENDIKRPKDLENLFDYARQKNCSIIRLDRDAEEIKELTTYEW